MRSICTSLACLILISGVVSCKTKRDSSQAEVAIDSLAALTEKGEQEEDYIFHNEKLIAYKEFIDHLDPFKATDIGEATTRFKADFSGENLSTIDSAYYIFENYYSLTEDRLNEDVSNDTIKVNQMLTDEKALENNGVKRTLQENGFQVSSSEGMSYIQKDRRYVEKNFYSFVSPVMREYLEELMKEDQQGYWEDGGLVISPIQLIDRMIWWEVFVKEHPQFIFKNLPNEKMQMYLTSLVKGEDNTPLFEDEWRHNISPYFQEAYKYLFEKYPASKAAADLRPYYDLLLKHDLEEVRKFQEALY